MVSRLVAVVVLVSVLVLDFFSGSHDKVGAQKEPDKGPTPEEGGRDVGPDGCVSLTHLIYQADQEGPKNEVSATSCKQNVIYCQFTWINFCYLLSSPDLPRRILDNFH